MPKLARWYVKSAMIYLLLGAVLAALALSNAAPLPRGLLALRPLAWHLLTFGWATQLIFGVAYWMFPHLSKEVPRGDERVLWAAYWTLNAGLLLRAVGEPVVLRKPVYVNSLLAKVLVNPVKSILRLT
jgi:heme/copper-type cytochrome/quinol oxidase subunit 1